MARATETTIKVSHDTRDRLRTYGDKTYEETILRALDLLDIEDFWKEADAAIAEFNALPAEERERYRAAEAEWDAAFDGVRSGRFG